jgi:aminopeptidase N
VRRAALLLAAAMVAACASPGVRSESATEQTSPPTAPAMTTTPPPTPTDPQPPESEPTADPDDTTPPDTEVEATEPSIEERPDLTTEEEPGPEPSTDAPAGDVESIGDSLFPELGTDDLDVQSYDVRLAYDPATQVIDGAVTVDAVVVAESERLVLDAVELDVEAVTVDGTPAEVNVGTDELVITPATPPATGAAVAIDVQYTARAQQAGSFDGIADLGWFATTAGSYVLNQPDGARTWLPSNDHPADKALWRFELTVPAGTTAVANGALIEQRPSAEGTTWVWEQSQPMATYVVQLLTGDYEILERAPAGTVPIVDVVLAEDVEQMAPYFELTDDQLAFFQLFFGPYPLDRYGLAFTDSPSGLAMEQQGRSLYSRDDFPGDRVGVIEHYLLSHELAHMWFGDAVSPADWRDVWLNESFATYGQWMWFDHVDLLPLEIQADANLARRQDFTEPTAEPTVENLLGFERYDGGAVVLHALRLELGDEPFFTLLKTWVAENNGTSRTTEDFIALANRVAGRDLTAFFDAWLFAADVPDAYPG